jgi:hypothetical protein
VKSELQIANRVPNSQRTCLIRCRSCAQSARAIQSGKITNSKRGTPGVAGGGTPLCAQAGEGEGLSGLDVRVAHGDWPPPLRCARMRSRTILTILVVAIVNAAGCGGSDHKNVNPEAMLDAAAAHPISSAETETDLRLQVRGVQQLSGPLRLRLSGPYVSGGGRQIPKFDWRMNASALGFPVGGHLVSSGTNVYLTLYGDKYQVGTDAVAAANDRIAASGAVHPRSWFCRARVDGQGHEGGVDCERISAPLRGDAVARDIAPLTSSLGLSEAPSVSGTASACVGFDDRVLHELQVRAVLNGPTSADLDLDVVISDVGEPQDISIPAGGGFRPIRDLALQLNDLGVSIPLG